MGSTHIPTFVDTGVPSGSPARALRRPEAPEEPHSAKYAEKYGVNPVVAVLSFMRRVFLPFQRESRKEACKLEHLNMIPLSP